MTLTEFLLARIAEQEEWAWEALRLSDYGVTRDWLWVRFYGPVEYPNLPSSTTFYAGAPTPQQVIAECERKRQVVALREAYRNGVGPDRWNAGRNDAADAMCRILASAYVDHVDYQPEWKP